MFIIERNAIDKLFEVLQQEGFQIAGPTVRDGAIIYDKIASAQELPIGWTDEQNGGTYRLKKRSDAALFGYVIGPQAWKKFLYPPHIKLWQAKREKQGFKVFEEKDENKKMAFIGVRSCELNAIAIQDKVFLSGAYGDPVYKSNRANLFVVAVNCVQAGGTCFCVSMKTGPKATSGFDLSLTEVLQDSRHYFIVEVGSDRGLEVLKKISHQQASETDVQTAAALSKKAENQMGRILETQDIKRLLYDNFDHPRWDEVAKRCLSCANCTLVCPTCFCTTVEDVTDLTGDHAERWRKWDSCFSLDFTKIHGGSIRPSTKARYRQWITHKLASWIDQFGTSGCVGCGRCITWCPVGIDITEEVQAIKENKIIKEQSV